MDKLALGPEHRERANFFRQYMYTKSFDLIKGSFMPIFTNKYKYLGPLEFFENENFDVNEAQARRKFGFVLLKSCLTFG